MSDNKRICVGYKFYINCLKGNKMLNQHFDNAIKSKNTSSLLPLKEVM